MDICEKCGNELPSSAEFCPNCGSAAGPVVAKPMKKSKKKLIIGIAIVVIVAIAVAGYFLIFHKQVIDKDKPYLNFSWGASMEEVKDKLRDYEGYAEYQGEEQGEYSLYIDINECMGIKRDDIFMVYRFEYNKLTSIRVWAGGDFGSDILDEDESNDIFNNWYKSMCSICGESQTTNMDGYKFENWADDYTGYNLVNVKYAVRLLMTDRESFLEDLKQYL